MGKCLYKQTYSGTNVIMTCNLSKELRKEYADYIWDAFDERPKSHKSDPDPKTDLMQLYLACKIFWAVTKSTNACSVKIATSPNYRFVNKSGFKITASGDEGSFRAEAFDSKTNQKLSMDHDGRVKGGKPKGDLTIVLKEKCVITHNGKVVQPKKYLDID